ncbi:hypothetical protein MIR68_007761 [Amoeboaphelidium protococcarum]|nr:hypothetical protein MIR68_007761 [Amoeboaphelidium protococcarum]
MADYIKFCEYIENLKVTRRTGWLRNGIAPVDAESIADHMHRMAIIAMTMPTDHVHASTKATFSVNRDKCVQMCLVHDLAECIVGDITPHDNVSKQEKAAMELYAMQRLTRLVSNDGNDGGVSSNIMSLFQEYEDHESNESLVVHDIDKLEMVMQADTYERRHGIQLDAFFESTRNVFRTQWALSLYQTLVDHRIK